jgi:hypothetical protein
MPALEPTPDLAVTKRPKWFWLRVAVSGLFGLLTVASCVLWTQSYREVQYLHFDLGQIHSAGIHSYRGTATAYAMHNNIAWLNRIRISIIEGRKINVWSPRSGFGRGTTGCEWWLSVPHWLITTLAAATAIAMNPFRARVVRRFSLRTLLLATTLFAVNLGVVAWVLR